jgi:hypothetical protein
MVRVVVPSVILLSDVTPSDLFLMIGLWPSRLSITTSAFFYKLSYPQNEAYKNLLLGWLAAAGQPCGCWTDWLLAVVDFQSCKNGLLTSCQLSFESDNYLASDSCYGT